ncbi:MFS transporter [Streptomyces sp. G2]|uniref:MFS transporter n=1 Tax=Streptomyces TaxID=1883 RepID=UPI00202FF24D|nr:MFS transporter [Streptomyces sp. G2]MCM1951397.1 MFS transporter [Streptomyces sp. G2]
MTIRLGRSYALLWTASALSYIGDGILITASPLLVLSLTSEPMVVAAAEVALTLPYLLFGIIGGVVVDRLDRRRLMVTLDFARAVLLLLVLISLSFDVVQIPVLLCTLFLLTTADTVFRTAAQTALPSIVPKEGLVKANARLMSAEIVGAQFAGPALGGLLFAGAVALPFLANGVSFALSGLLLLLALPARRATRAASEAAEPGTAPGPFRAGVLKEAAEGVRWLWTQSTLRFLAASSATINFFTGATNAILVLYVHQVLHLSNAAFGLVVACGAAGGVIAGMVAGRVATKFGTRNSLVFAVALQAVGQGILFVSSNTVLTVLALACAGFAMVQFSSVSVALRQSTIPDHLLGRATSVYRMLAWGSLPLGALTAGLAVTWTGIRSTFALGAVVLTALTFWVLLRSSDYGLGDAKESDEPAPSPEPKSGTGSNLPQETS